MVRVTEGIQTGLFTDKEGEQTYVRWAQNTVGIRHRVRGLNEEEISRFTDGGQTDISTIAGWGVVEFQGNRRALAALRKTAERDIREQEARRRRGNPPSTPIS